MLRIVLNEPRDDKRNIVVRYPIESDAEEMLRYINALSQEKTYIRAQGEQLTIEHEKKYLTSQLEKIAKKNAVKLLLFIDTLLIGVAGIEMLERTERHTGVLGISIDKAYRGEGFGNLLMKLLETEAKANIPELEIVTLCVFAKNVTGKAMYEKFGYKVYGYLPKGIKYKEQYDDLILMYKTV